MKLKRRTATWADVRPLKATYIRNPDGRSGKLIVNLTIKLPKPFKRG